MSFLEGYIDQPLTDLARTLQDQKMQGLYFQEMDPRNTRYALDLQQAPLNMSVVDEFNAVFLIHGVGSIYPETGLAFSATTIEEGAILPINTQLHWLQDNDVVGVGIAR